MHLAMTTLPAYSETQPEFVFPDQVQPVVDSNYGDPFAADKAHQPPLVEVDMAERMHNEQIQAMQASDADRARQAQAEAESEYGRQAQAAADAERVRQAQAQALLAFDERARTQQAEARQNASRDAESKHDNPAAG